jgi:membrane associated rhomboid family serine protease
VVDGAYWQLLTSMFVHVSIWHIGFNMLAVWLFGPQLEMILGRARFLALYFGAGLVGSAFVYWLSGVPSVTYGASGAVFGLFAAYLLFALKTRQNVSSLLVILALNVFISLRDGISWQGHLGGFVGGLAIAALFIYTPRPRRSLLHGVGLGVIAVALVAAVLARTLTLS